MSKTIKVKKLIEIDKIEEIDYKGFVYGLKIEKDPSYCLGDGILTKNCDLPDIDLDFEDIKRDKVKEHLEECYGKECVVGLSTFMKMKGRAALRDVARVFEIPYQDVDAAAKSIVVRCLDGDSLVYTTDRPIPIKELIDKKNFEVYACYGNKIVTRTVNKVFINPAVEMYEVVLESGKRVICSAEHKFWAVKKGWQELKKIKLTDRILTLGFEEEYLNGQLCKKAIENNYECIMRITYAGMRKAYDLSIKGRFKGYLVNGIQTHNSGGDFRCLAEDTNVYTPEGEKEISSIVSGDFILGFSTAVKWFEFREVSDVFDSGEADVFEIEFDSGKKIICTEDHKIFANGEWKMCKDISLGDSVITLGDKEMLITANTFGLIYKTVNNYNGKIYIGQTIKDLRTRRRGHLKESKSNKKDNNCFKNAIRKYGIEGFTWSIIDFANSQEELNAKEIAWIKKNHSLIRENGYNSKTGGNSGSAYTESARRNMSLGRKGKGIGAAPWNKGKKMSEESRLKISAALVGNTFRKGKLGKNNKPKIIKERKPRVFSEETRRRISEAQMGNKYSLGYRHSEETRKKMSESRKGKCRKDLLGRKMSDETKLKISASLKGRIVSEETRRKMSISFKGHPGYMKGRHLTEEQRRKISEANRRRKGIKRKKDYEV